jgi:RND family efflux transporter MFP subunit
LPTDSTDGESTVPTHKFLVFLRYLVLIALVSSIVIVIISLITNRETTLYLDPPPAVVIAKPTQGTIEKHISLAGHIEAESMIPVVPLVSGTIVEFPVTVGTSVQKGDVLAVIDDTPYRQQMLQAEAAYLVAQTTFERVQRLYEIKATTQQNYEQAKAQRDATKAQLELASLQLNYAQVTSPVSGTVLSTVSAKGDMAGNQVPIAVIADLSHLVVRLAVPEKYFDTIWENKDSLYASVFRTSSTMDQGTISSKATIDTIAPYVRAQSKTFEVVCTLTDNAESFRPGMYVTVRLVYESMENAYLLRQTDRTIDHNIYAYAHETSTAQWVELLPVVEDEHFFALPPGFEETWFIVDGQHLVFDGQKVTVIGQRED